MLPASSRDLKMRTLPQLQHLSCGRSRIQAIKARAYAKVVVIKCHAVPA